MKLTEGLLPAWIAVLNGQAIFGYLHVGWWVAPLSDSALACILNQEVRCLFLTKHSRITVTFCKLLFFDCLHLYRPRNRLNTDQICSSIFHS